MTALESASDWTLYAVRHARTDAEGVLVGRLDVPLAVDVDVAVASLERALPSDVEELWTSPLQRCREPAERCARLRRIACRIDHRLLEVSLGRFEGRAIHSLERDEWHALHRWMDRWVDEGPPGGESARELEERVAGWVRERIERPPRIVGLVAHAGVVRALRVVLGGCSWQDAMRSPVPHDTCHRFVGSLASTSAPSSRGSGRLGCTSDDSLV